MKTTIKRVISEDVAKRIGPCWGQDAQGDIVTKSASAVVFMSGADIPIWFFAAWSLAPLTCEFPRNALNSDLNMFRTRTPMAPSKSNKKRGPKPNGTEQHTTTSLERNFIEGLFWIGWYGEDDEVRDWRGLLFRSDEEIANFVKENLPSDSQSDECRGLSTTTVAHIRTHLGPLYNPDPSSSQVQAQEFKDEFKGIFEKAKKLNISLSKRINPSVIHVPAVVGSLGPSLQRELDKVKETFDSQFGPTCKFSEHLTSPETENKTIDFYNLGVLFRSTRAQNTNLQNENLESMIDLNINTLLCVLVKIAILDKKGKTEQCKNSTRARSEQPFLPAIAVDALYSLWKMGVIKLGGVQPTKARALFSAWLDQAAAREPEPRRRGSRRTSPVPVEHHRMSPNPISPGFQNFLDELDASYLLSTNQFKSGSPLLPWLDPQEPESTSIIDAPHHVRPSVEVSDLTTDPNHNHNHLDNHNHDHPSLAFHKQGNQRLLPPLPDPRPNLVDVLHTINPRRGSRSEPPQSRSDFESACALLDVL
ncbi:hypothetical protein T439DRAFT_366060 [Meredithblackwellia eburnea MCA 4105]